MSTGALVVIGLVIWCIVAICGALLIGALINAADRAGY